MHSTLESAELPVPPRPHYHAAPYSLQATRPLTKTCCLSCRSREVHSSNPRTYTYVPVIVDGHVQFGKTTNMAAVTSYALDCGFKLVWVLAGTQNNLRNQTQQRFERYFPAPFAAASDAATLRNAPLLWLTSQSPTESTDDTGDIYSIVKGLVSTNGATVSLTTQPASSCRGLRDLLSDWESLQHQRSRPSFIGVIKKDTRALQVWCAIMHVPSVLQ